MNKIQIKLTRDYMQSLLQRCIDEDGGFHGDVTTRSIVSKELKNRFTIRVRGKGTIAGLNAIADSIDVFEGLAMELLHHDGNQVQDECIAIVEGPTQMILVAERTILNILGHASGIATLTRQFVEVVSGTQCEVCDTRKTTPGLRVLEKYAVTCGGGTSHRLGLHDAALYKDNHVFHLEDYSSQLGCAIDNIQSNQSLSFIEVEVDTIEQLEQVLLMPVDIVLLDNMTNDQLTRAVSMRDCCINSPLLEASGGVTLDSIREIAETGVDRIAVGALTHQASWLDIGLDAINE